MCLRLYTLIYSVYEKYNAGSITLMKTHFDTYIYNKPVKTNSIPADKL